MWNEERARSRDTWGIINKDISVTTSDIKLHVFIMGYITFSFGA